MWGRCNDKWTDINRIKKKIKKNYSIDVEKKHFSTENNNVTLKKRKPPKFRLELKCLSLLKDIYKRFGFNVGHVNNENREGSKVNTYKM